MAPEPSMMAETTTITTAYSSYAREETTTITETGLLMTVKTMATASKAINTYTNTDTMPSIGTYKETGLFLDPVGVTQDPIDSDNSFLSSGPSVSDREIEQVMREIGSIETMENTV